MARNGSGTFSLPEAPFVSGTVISSTAVNSDFSDVANALTASIANDGQTPITANLPMSGYRHTGVGNSSARTMYAATGQVQDSSFTWCGTAGGTADALTLTPTPAITAYAAGQKFAFKASSSANTGAATVAISGLTTKALQLNDAALAAGDIAANKYYEILYDGTAFQVQRVSGTAAAAASETVAGIAEIATQTEANTGTDDGRIMSPAKVHNLVPGTVTIDAAADKVWIADGSDSGKLKLALLPGGGLPSNVKQATITAVFSSSSTSYADITGASVSITPSSATSRILVMAYGVFGNSGANPTFIQLVRDSTAINVGDAASTRIRASVGREHAASDRHGPFSIVYIDSPATTSATTYKLQIITSGGTSYVGRSGDDTDNASHARYPTVIVVMEIGA